jgi:hypothetical protein
LERKIVEVLSVGILLEFFSRAADSLDRVVERAAEKARDGVLHIDFRELLLDIRQKDAEELLDVVLYKGLIVVPAERRRKVPSPARRRPELQSVEERLQIQRDRLALGFDVRRRHPVDNSPELHEVEK